MIVIAFYVVPFITSSGRGQGEGSVLVAAIMEFYFVFFSFFFLSCFSCASFYYWCCYIPFEKCLLRVLYNFCFHFLFFFGIFLGISLWLFVLVQALLVSI